MPQLNNLHVVKLDRPNHQCATSENDEWSCSDCLKIFVQHPEWWPTRNCIQVSKTEAEVEFDVIRIPMNDPRFQRVWLIRQKYKRGGWEGNATFVDGYMNEVICTISWEKCTLPISSLDSIDFDSDSESDSESDCDTESETDAMSVPY